MGESKSPTCRHGYRRRGFALVLLQIFASRARKRARENITFFPVLYMSGVLKFGISATCIGEEVGKTLFRREYGIGMADFQKLSPV